MYLGGPADLQAVQLQRKRGGVLEGGGRGPGTGGGKGIPMYTVAIGTGGGTGIPVYNALLGLAILSDPLVGCALSMNWHQNQSQELIRNECVAQVLSCQAMVTVNTHMYVLPHWSGRFNQIVSNVMMPRWYHAKPCD